MHVVQCMWCDQWVVGSVPTQTKLRNNLVQVVHTYVPLSPSSMTWYWSKDDDVLRLQRWPPAWRKVKAAYRLGWLKVTSTPGSAPSLTFGDKYGRSGGCLTSQVTHYRSYRRRSSRSITWQVPLLLLKDNLISNRISFIVFCYDNYIKVLRCEKYLLFEIPNTISPKKVLGKVFKCPQINMYLVFYLNTSFWVFDPTLIIGHIGDGLPVNHLASTSKTEPNYNQIHLTTQKTYTTSKKLQAYTLTKPNETKTWFRRFLCYPAKKRRGSILQPQTHMVLGTS